MAMKLQRRDPERDQDRSDNKMLPDHKNYWLLAKEFSVQILPLVVSTTNSTSQTTSQSWPPSETSNPSVSCSIAKFLTQELKGDFSVARLQAFHVYRHTTSPLWLTIVLLATPFPMLIIVIAVLSIPQQPIEKGWSGNCSFFVQVFIGAVLVVVGGQLQRPHYVTAIARISIRQNLALAVGLAGLLTFMLLLLSATIFFPMPFGAFTPVLIAVLIFFIVMTIVVKHKHRPNRVFAKAPDPNSPAILNHQNSDPNLQLFNKYKRIVAYNYSLLFIYPIYLVGFRLLRGPAQLVYLMLLPLLKALLVAVARRRLCHLGDLMAASTVFSVEWVNSMILSLSMGGGEVSMQSSLVIVAIDLCHMALTMTHLLDKSRALTKIFDNEKLARYHLTFDNAVEWCLAFVSANRNRVNWEKYPNIRLEASNNLSFERPKLGHLLLQLGSSTVQEAHLPNTHFHSKHKSASNKCPCQSTDPTVQQQQLELLQHTLSFMYMVEYIVLVEYVECAVPMMMAMYYLMIYLGPNRAYNLDLCHMTSSQFQSSVSSIVFYGLLEWTSLLLLFGIVKRRFKWNVFYSLGFVLETQLFDIQGKFAVFLMQLLVMRFLHYGVDFSFQFEWLHRRENLMLGSGAGSNL